MNPSTSLPLTNMPSMPQTSYGAAENHSEQHEGNCGEQADAEHSINAPLSDQSRLHSFARGILNQEQPQPPRRTVSHDHECRDEHAEKAPHERQRDNLHVLVRDHDSLVTVRGLRPHCILHHVPQKHPNGFGLRDYDAQQEAEANWLGPALLVSEEAALSIVRRRLTLPQASDEYRVTENIVRMRTNLTGAFKRA